jgi:PadR family transcriptional regulator PadR
MSYQSWNTQLRKGALDAAVLGVLCERGPCYGLELLDAFQAAGLNLSEGALYPLLGRLEKTGLLNSEWRLDDGAPRPRKYYALTEEGRALLVEIRANWPDFRDQVDTLIMKGGQT